MSLAWMAKSNVLSKDACTSLPTVGKDSKPATVAGALAARVREKKDVSLVAIGVDAVANAVVSTCTQSDAACHTYLAFCACVWGF